MLVAALTLLLIPVLSAIPASDRAPTARSIGPDELVPVIRAHVAESCRRGESDVEVQSVGDVSGILVPDGPVTFRVRDKTMPASYRNQLVGVEAVVDGRTVRSFWITVNVVVRGPYLRVRRRVPFGTVVASADIEPVYAELPDLRTEYFKALDEVVGKLARRMLSQGDPLSRDLLTDPFLVRNGETVRLRLERNGIAVAGLAQAEQNGKIGQIVRVRNLDFSRCVRARVVARGEVHVD